MISRGGGVQRGTGRGGGYYGQPQVQQQFPQGQQQVQQQRQFLSHAGAPIISYKAGASIRGGKQAAEQTTSTGAKEEPCRMLRGGSELETELASQAVGRNSLTVLVLSFTPMRPTHNDVPSITPRSNTTESLPSPRFLPFEIPGDVPYGVDRATCTAAAYTNTDIALCYSPFAFSLSLSLSLSR